MDISKNNIGQKLKKLRLRKGYSATEVYKKLNVNQSTFSSWETGRSEPPLNMFFKLCELYEVNDILSEFSDAPMEYSLDSKPSMHELMLIDGFRKLDPDTQEDVFNLINHLALKNNRVVALSVLPANLKPVEQTANISFSPLKKNAIANLIPKEIELPVDSVPRNADSICVLNDNSMEPLFNSGDKLYVQNSDSLNYGDIGVFEINGDLYVKVYENGRIVSLNPKFAALPIDESSFKIIGKILRKVD